MHTSDRARLIATVLDSFPKLNEREQKISLGLYRALAEGRPVSHRQLATSLNLKVGPIDDALSQWWDVLYDDDKRITGYGGLTLARTTHRFTISEKALHAWCAWDTLFIPELLGQTVRVESSCPNTKRRIRLTVTPQGVIDLDPPGVVMSWLTPETVKVRENVVANFCQYVHFFRSADAGADWVSERRGTFVVTVEEAYALGKGTNAVRYADTLNARSLSKER
jgi:alkylmercury lyase